MKFLLKLVIVTLNFFVIPFLFNLDDSSNLNKKQIVKKDLVEIENDINLDDVFSNYDINNDDMITIMNADLNTNNFDISEILIEDDIYCFDSASFVFTYNIEFSKLVIDMNLISDNFTYTDSAEAYVFENENEAIDAIITFDDDTQVILSEAAYDVNLTGILSNLIYSCKNVFVFAICGGTVGIINASYSKMLRSNIADNNYKYNKTLVEPSSYIYGQDCYVSWKFGANTMNNNGCGIIALYNCLLGIGNRKNLADIAYEFESSGGALLYGFFGADPTEYKNYFNKYDIAYKKYGSYKTLDKNIKKMNENQMFIVCAWNSDHISKGAHYVSGRFIDNQICIYNLYRNGSCEYYFDTFDKSIIGGNLIAAFIVG